MASSTTEDLINRLIDVYYPKPNIFQNVIIPSNDSVSIISDVPIVFRESIQKIAIMGLFDAAYSAGHRLSFQISYKVSLGGSILLQDTVSVLDQDIISIYVTSGLPGGLYFDVVISSKEVYSQKLKELAIFS